MTDDHEYDDRRTGDFCPARLGQPHGAELTLLLYHRGGAEAVVMRESLPVVVGRGPDADLTLRAEGVSRRHARFELVGDQVWVTDLGSTNGVVVDGQRVSSSTIGPGQTVALGAVTVTVHRLEPGDEPLTGLERHDRLMALTTYECAQAKAFGRTFALMMVRASDGPADLQAAFPTIQRRLRPVDRIALYSPDTLEMLLPEVSREEALELALALVGGAPGQRHRRRSYLCGLAMFPGNGTSNDELTAAAISAMARATPERPVEGGQAHTGDFEAAVDAERLVVQSQASRALHELLDRVSQSDIPVLIVGETGSGKEVAARAIHARSQRSRQPFVCVNCAAIPAPLLESLLFGHVRGAFTGADRDAEGMLEAAGGGTVLLDEIGELTPSAQAALLRFLDRRCITRVGSTKETPLDVRVLAATNRDIGRMSAAGDFRQDLLFRINGITVRVPPLREREHDILPLADLFLSRACQANRRTIEGFEPEAARVLRHYRWPGNVRELRNMIDRAVVLCSAGKVRLEDLGEGLQELQEPDENRTTRPMDPLDLAALGADLNLRTRIRRVETDLIVEALRRTDGNRTAAAALLGVPVRTLTRRMVTLKVRGLGFGAAEE
jgi:two-component system, NtrC family, response regulator AtoC